MHSHCMCTLCICGLWMPPPFQSCVIMPVLWIVCDVNHKSLFTCVHVCAYIIFFPFFFFPLGLTESQSCLIVFVYLLLTTFPLSVVLLSSASLSVSSELSLSAPSPHCPVFVTVVFSVNPRWRPLCFFHSSCIPACLYPCLLSRIPPSLSLSLPLWEV